MMVEELNWHLEGEPISPKRLKRVWKSISGRPFPSGKIRAFIVNENEFYRIQEVLNNYPGILNLSFQEYGVDRPVNDKDTDAFCNVETLPDGSKGFLIVIERESPFSIGDRLKHELRHIAKREITISQTEP